MPARFIDHIPAAGDHASRPAAASTPKGALYSCTDHSIIYRCDGAAWANWIATTTGGGAGGTPTRLTGTASSSIIAYSTYVPANMLDGTLSTWWWGSSNVALNDWVRIDLGASYTIDSVVIYQNDTETSAGNNYMMNGWAIEHSADGTTWTSVKTGNTKAAVVTGLAVTARYVRLRATAATSGWTAVREFEVYGY